MPTPIQPIPVIVVHLDTADGAHLTACTGTEFDPDNGLSSPKTPRVLCTGCQRAAMNGHAYSLPDGTVITITNNQTIISRPTRSS